mgnify:CR=1 FL=1
MNIKEETRKMKLASPILAAASLEKRNHALALIRESLLANREEIFAANHKDLALAEESGIAPAVKKQTDRIWNRQKKMGLQRLS